MKKVLKTAVHRFDRILPHPLFYQFIMSDAERAAFDDVIRTSSGYLEFGMGGSTLRVLRKSKATVYSVESSAAWVAHMRGYYAVRRAEQGGRLRVVEVDIGPTAAWGRPTSDEHKDRFPQYSSSVFDIVEVSKLDTVLIDGRFRVACALQAALRLPIQNQVRIMFHDFWDRPKYHVVLKYFEPMFSVETLAVMSVKTDIDLAALKSDCDAYVGIAD